MSRRGAVLEGYKAPPALDVTPILQGMRIAQEENHYQQDRKDRLARREEKDKTPVYGWIDKNYNPNDALSGDPLTDPVYQKGMQRIHDDAYTMATQGYDIGQIQQILASKANNLNQYSKTAKAINQNIDEQLKAYPNNAGYNIPEIKKRARLSAFMDADGNLKTDIADIDPTLDYVGEALTRFPKETTGYEGLQGFINKEMTNAKPDVRKVKTYNSKGGYTMADLEVTAPDWMVLDKDVKGNNLRQLVPDYEIATDGEGELYHEFKLPDGKVSKEPVRVVTDKVYDYVRKNNPAYLTNLRGQLLEHIKEGDYKDENGEPISLNSPAAQNLLKGLMYNDLKMGSKGGVKDIVTTKPTQVKVSVNTSGGKGSGSDAAVNDLYGKIQNKVDTDIENLGDENKTVYTRVNALGTDAASIISKTANDLMPDAKLGIADLFLHKDDSGEINIYQVDDDGKVVVDEKYKIGTLPKVGTNLKVQPNTKAKVEVVKQGDNKTKSNSKPEIVEQNGHKYKLNKSTGKYEPFK